MEVVPGVHQIEVGRFTHCFVVLDPVPTLIDCGAPQQAGHIAGYVATHLGYSVNDVRRLILTHADLDHAGSAPELCWVTGMPAYVHPLDVPALLERRRSRPLARALATEVLRWRLSYPMPPRLHPLEDGQVIDGLRVIHTPGHTPGHVCLLWRNVLFAGDAFVTGERFRMSPRLLSQDREAEKRSLHRLLEHEFDVAVSGHGPPSAGARERLCRLVDSLDGKKERG